MRLIRLIFAYFMFALAIYDAKATIESKNTKSLIVNLVLTATFTICGVCWMILFALL